MNVNASQIQKILHSKQDEKKAQWLENYVKHDIKSLGVGIPELRNILIDFEKEHCLKSQSWEAQVDFLNDLMANEFTESKLIAILYLQLFCKTTFEAEILKISSEWFDKHWITDWNVCDWLCIRLLTPILDRSPEQAISTFEKWNQDANFWKARASLVPFAMSKTLRHHPQNVHQFSSVLIQRPERFSKTAVGWVLREFSKHDSKFAIDFMEEFKQHTTKEVVKNALKYIK
jgi:3-methyladenine DNA glycosylase AlkD